MSTVGATTTNPTTAPFTGSNSSVISNINNANAASQSQIASQSPTGGSSATSLNTTFNTFLTMLTTQLKNQDPLSPTDSTQFTNQLVQFSSVEQEINTTSNLTQMISLQKTSQQAGALGYIGQTVEVSGGNLPLQSGNSYFTYTMPSAATSASINIQDSTGTTVATLSSVDGSAGVHKMSWNGANLSGGTSPDGQYTITMTATSSTGATLAPTISTYGKVTGITSDSTGTDVALGAVSVPLANIQSIVDPNSLTSTSSSSTTTGG